MWTKEQVEFLKDSQNSRMEMRYIAFVLGKTPYQTYLKLGELGLTRSRPYKGVELRAYRTWINMRGRCYNEDDSNYDNYGGRGITIEEVWRHDPSPFIGWFVRRYKDGRSIDRVDNDGNYSPSNCRLATRIEQSRNKRTNRMLTAFGETKCVVEWTEDERCRVPYKTLSCRINCGMLPEDAITFPLHKRGGRKVCR